MRKVFIVAALMIGCDGWAQTKMGPIAPSSVNGAYDYCSASGMHCDDATDDTSAFNALLLTVYNQGGGTIIGTPGKTSLISGQITLPNNASGSQRWAQYPIKIQGPGGAGTYDQDNISDGLSFTLDMRYNATYGKLVTLGQGSLTVDGVNFVDGGSDCAAFVYTTATTLFFDKDRFQGTRASSTAGVTSFSISGGTGTFVASNIFHSGDSVTFSDFVTSNFLNGQTVTVLSSGLSSSQFEASISHGNVSSTETGNAVDSASCNDAFIFGGPDATGDNALTSAFSGYGTVLESNTFSQIRRAVTYGAYANATVVSNSNILSNSGSADGAFYFNSNSSANAVGGPDKGNVIENSTVEVPQYAFAIYANPYSEGNSFVNNSCWDFNGYNTACVHQDAATSNNTIIAGEYYYEHQPYVDNYTPTGTYLVPGVTFPLVAHQLTSPSGSGGLVLTTPDSSPIEMQTDGTTRWSIDAAGNFDSAGGFYAIGSGPSTSATAVWDQNLYLVSSNSSSYESILAAPTITANRNVNFPDASGTVPLIPGSPTTGRATCWKTATTIGYCSTVVASDGSCTCN
jgi:hypothetical protein